MQIYPEQRKWKSPPEKLGITLGALENQQPQTGQQKRKNLGTHSPQGCSGPGSTKSSHACNVGRGAAAQVKQKERRSQHRGENQNQPSPASSALGLIEKKLAQPLVRDPGLAGSSVGKWIGVRHAMVLRDVLPGLEVPPYVRVGDIARRHGE